MKPRPKQTALPKLYVGSGSVRSDEVLSLREFGRRLGLARRALCDCQRNGLRCVVVGRAKYIIGSDALAWFAQQAAKQAAGGGDD
ncbi:MAG: hypothetical protein NTW96_01865 [Planctomycetia bacterium]|nr:hypothetical protein [Planctomycetia bacterium]